MEQFNMSPKDKLIICTKANHEAPSKYQMPPALPNEKRPGVILPNGQINWTCPCLGGLPYGPCGFEFRQFFECIHREEEDAGKAQECLPKFTAMKKCFNEFPKLYPPEEDDELGDLPDPNQAKPKE